MKDEYRAAHFDLHAENLPPLSEKERIRIKETVAMVPDNWKSIVDVGCGDGRIARELQKREAEVLGLDWSQQSAARFQGPTTVCDIRAPWPFERLFDGAVCCEVLEHLEASEAQKVVANLKAFTRRGFLITVPAREALKGNFVVCQKCGQQYHIWGHCRSFNTFEEVDAMVGLRSLERKLITTGSRSASERLLVWQRQLGTSQWSASYLCPYCGESLSKPPRPPLVNRALSQGVSVLQRLGAPFRPTAGWFACLYRP